MLSISTKSIYGLCAIVALAQQGKGVPLQMRAIADSQNIPLNYLEHLLATLKKAGYIQSIRGAQGGYLLAEKPKDISVADILTCLEGPVSLTDVGQQCTELDFFWKSIEEKVNSLFNVTIQDILLDKQRLKSLLTYSI